MLVFIHKYIKRIVDVKVDDKCGYRAISSFLGKGDENHTLVCQQLIKELKERNESHTTLCREKEHFDAIRVSLIHRVIDLELKEKWICYSQMDHLIANVYNMVCIDLTRYGFPESFFHFRVAHLKIQQSALCVLDDF